MKNSEQPANPLPCTINEHGVYTTESSQDGHLKLGLTKREYAAVQIASGIVTMGTEYKDHSTETLTVMAHVAVELADLLFEELEKSQPQEQA